ncbi:MAG TPA: DUF4139 domain-containing protein [Candidatus Dormibacteraeota bacterium]|nr:DUF4139 domain-containing protein [Candidatus Dormibacteraeota bacterium]
MRPNRIPWPIQWFLRHPLKSLASAALLFATLLAVPQVSRVHAAKRAQDNLAVRPNRQTETERTTLDDQSDLAVTVYNSNIALVRDVRQITLPTGSFLLRFEDIAATINPATVHFRSLSEPDKLTVLEQNYEYDLLDPAKLLHKYVGREVTLERTYLDNNTTKHEDIKATLLADNNGTVWRIGKDIVTGVYAQSYRFPEVPETLYDRPTLLWSLENGGARKHKVEASYLATNLSWNADYVLTIARDDKAGDLDGWVTLTNNSGAAFKKARLQLVAGDVHRVQEQYARDAAKMEVMSRAAGVAGNFAQENFSEYHLYTLGRRTSVFDKESKQISLLNATAVPVGKVFVVEGQQFYYHNPQHPGTPLKDVVKVFYKFRNEEKAGLGIPLPAGNVRVYQTDSKGGILFVGEDHIDHTPKDESLTIHIGNAFDVVCERKQTDFRKLSDRVYEMEFEITLRNHKESPIIVEINEPIGGDWEMLSSSHKYTKTAAFAAQFHVPVEKNGSAVLKYRIRMHW